MADDDPIIPHSNLPDGVGFLIQIRAALDGSYPPARNLFARTVQDYAEKLDSESARQEVSARAPGALTREITETAVIRARDSLEQEPVTRMLASLEQDGARRQPASLWESAALAGSPMFAGAAGVIGAYLHSPLQWAAFSLCALGGVICILYLLKRRLL
jgi:hypothetical protein